MPTSNFVIPQDLEQDTARLRTYAVQYSMTVVFANVFGETEAEYVEVCHKLDGAEGLGAIELHVSCPNTDAGGMIFGNDQQALARVTDACRALAVREGNVFTWFWIGSHDEYEQILKG